MNELSILSAASGVFSPADAHRLGVTRHGLAALVRSGEVIRLGRSTYAERRRFEDGSPEQQHRLRTTAVLASFDSRVAASHYSALALLQLPVFGADLRQVHLSRRSDHLTRRREGLTVHGSYERDDAYRFVNGLPCVVPALAVLGTAITCGVESGVVAADAALAAGLVTTADLQTWLGQLTPRRNGCRAARAVELADARSESVGESRTRLILHLLDLHPTPQVRIRDCDGAVVGRCDFVFEEQKVVVEFDGVLKYSGADGRAALVAEKQREDRLRELGYQVVRLTWSDLSHPDLINARVRRALGAPGRGFGLRRR